MKTPIDLAKKFIFIPLENLPEKFLKKVNISKILKNASDAAFEISKDTALVMLFCDAISILSSHNEQIKGLKKSNKDSKETLIELERIERNLDLALTIVPPTLLNRAIKKKLESFQVTTKKAEDLMFNYIGPGVGAHKTELKSTEYMRPLTEKAIRAVAKFTGAISNNKKLNPKTQEQFSKISNFCKSKIPDLNNMYIPRSIEEVTSYFDDMSHRVSPTIKSKLRNASAYDEIQGMVNGLCVASVIAYSILVSNVLMPILRNKILKSKKDKELAKMGETRESLKRKKRFAYTKIEPIKMEENIFDTFDSFNSPNIKKEIKVEPKQNYTTITPYQKSKTFETFNTYDRISQPTGLRI